MHADPHGIPQHAPGAKLDAGKLRAGLMFSDFARALEGVAAVTTFGAQKYTPSGWRIVPDGVARYTDALHRHLLAQQAGESTDPESGLPHLAHAAWNALAVLELSITHAAEEAHLLATASRDDIPMGRRAYTQLTPAGFADLVRRTGGDPS